MEPTTLMPRVTIQTRCAFLVLLWHVYYILVNQRQQVARRPAATVIHNRHISVVFSGEQRNALEFKFRIGL